MNVPFIPPTIVVGNEMDRVLFRKSFAEAQQDYYFRLDGHPVGGMFEGRTPFLILRDPNVIKNVLVRDFECFVDRLIRPIRPKSVSESSLLFLKGSDWRAVRHASTPIFSSAKMKTMSLCVIDCTEQMLKYLENHHKGSEIEMKSFFGRFTLNVIASSAFGIQCDSLANPEAEFVKVMSKFGNMTIAQSIALLISIVLLGNGWLARVLNVRFINLEIEKYLSKVVLDTKKYREVSHMEIEYFFTKYKI
jgi:cytochrome P450